MLYLGLPLGGPWKFNFCFNEIKILLFSVQVEFHHIRRSTNCMAVTLTIQKVERKVALYAHIM